MSGIQHQQSVFANLKVRPTIEFIDVKDYYCYNEDVKIKFTSMYYTPQECDRIALFKVGWIDYKDYICFQWATGCSERDSVVFEKNTLPKNTVDIYQVCYINGDNEVYAASPAFQFCETKPDNCDSMLSRVSLCETSTHQQNEMQKLREENDMLKECLKMVINEKKKNEKDIQTTLGRVNKALMDLDIKYENLKTMVEKHNCSQKKPEPAANYDLGELKSIPPFPCSTEINNMRG